MITTFIDEDSNKILKCDCNEDNVRLENVRIEMNSSGRSAFAIINNKLYITEGKLSGEIMMYNQQLTHIASINLESLCI